MLTSCQYTKAGENKKKRRIKYGKDDSNTTDNDFFSRHN